MGRAVTSQRLFFLIKPDGLELEETIMGLILPLATVLASRLFDPVSIEMVEKLYAVHHGKSFYPYLVNHFQGRPVKCFVLTERKGLVYHKSFFDDFLELVGDTDPIMAQPGTIRSLSKDSLEKALLEKRAVRNLVHRSTTPEEAEEEAAIFFGDYILDPSRIKGQQGVVGKYLAGIGQGIFYEERLEYTLRVQRLIAPDEELLYYQDLCCKPENFCEGIALVGIRRGGAVAERKIVVRWAT